MMMGSVDATGGWYAIMPDIMQGIIIWLNGITGGCTGSACVLLIVLPADDSEVDSVHSWIRGKGRVSAEARSGSGASRVVKTSCWSARRARREAHGLMEEAGIGMAHMAPSFVGLPKPSRASARGQARV